MLKKILKFVGFLIIGSAFVVLHNTILNNTRGDGLDRVFYTFNPESTISTPGNWWILIMWTIFILISGMIIMLPNALISVFSFNKSHYLGLMILSGVYWLASPNIHIPSGDTGGIWLAMVFVGPPLLLIILLLSFALRKWKFTYYLAVPISLIIVLLPIFVYSRIIIAKKTVDFHQTYISISDSIRDNSFKKINANRAVWDKACADMKTSVFNISFGKHDYATCNYMRAVIFKEPKLCGLIPYNDINDFLAERCITHYAVAYKDSEACEELTNVVVNRGTKYRYPEDTIECKKAITEGTPVKFLSPLGLSLIRLGNYDDYDNEPTF